MGSEVLNRMAVSDAARVLGVSVQAIHGRIKRGTIHHEKGEDGITYVFIAEDETTGAIENGVVNDLYNDYITALKSEIADWKEEARRKDTIIAQMNQSLQSLINRVPELEAPQDMSSEPTESSVSHRNGENRGDVPPEAQNRSWWRRIFMPDS
jgi:hypothetical protein